MARMKIRKVCIESSIFMTAEQVGNPKNITITNTKFLLLDISCCGYRHQTKM